MTDQVAKCIACGATQDLSIVEYWGERAVPPKSTRARYVQFNDNLCRACKYKGLCWPLVRYGSRAAIMGFFAYIAFNVSLILSGMIGPITPVPGFTVKAKGMPFTTHTSEETATGMTALVVVLPAILSFLAAAFIAFYAALSFYRAIWHILHPSIYMVHFSKDHNVRSNLIDYGSGSAPTAKRGPG